MTTLRTQIRDYLLRERDRTLKGKNSFWCTESEVDQFEIYHKFKGTPPTNPMTVETTFGLGMRTKLEDAVVSIFDKMNILVPPIPYTNHDGELIEDPDQHRVEMEKLGVPITGYMDAIVVELSEEHGKDEKKTIIDIVPVEIKTSYGSFQQRDLKACKPKTSYVKQLAQYVDFLRDNIDKYIPAIREMFPDMKGEIRVPNKGYLFQVHFERDLIVDDIYQFVAVRNGNKFVCGEVEFDLYEDVYKRYKQIYDDYIIPDIEPPAQFRYKYPLTEIDWRSLASSKISNARNGKAVIGDWQVTYSSYKDLLIEREGSTLGYTPQEIEYIKEQTKGYTTWKK